MIDVEAAGRAAPLPDAVVWARRHAWIGAWWLGGRSLVLVVAALVHVLGPRGYLRMADRSHLLGVLGAWDGHWYRIVAADGYLLVPGRQSDPAFFPLFPAMLNAVHTLGLGYLAAGVVIANSAFLVALLAFHSLTNETLGPALARRGTVYLAIFPLGYVFSMAYPESVVLAAMLLAALAALRGRWIAAAAFASAAALARPEGVFVALPLVAIAWRARHRLTPVRRGVAFGAAVAPVCACAAYPVYLARVLHDPLAWTRAEHAWGRQFTPLGLVHAVEHLGRAFGGNAWVVRDVVAAVLYVALLAAAARAGAPRAWLAAGAMVVLLPLFSGAFTSDGRFGLLAVPVFWGLAAAGRAPRADRAIRAASIVLLVAGTATIPFVFP